MTASLLRKEAGLAAAGYHAASQIYRICKKDVEIVFRACKGDTEDLYKIIYGTLYAVEEKFSTALCIHIAEATLAGIYISTAYHGAGLAHDLAPKMVSAFIDFSQEVIEKASMIG